MQQDCEESKSVHSPSLFQNREPEFIERYPQAGQLHVQIGSKGCIFLHPTCGGVEEICEIILGGGSISVPVSMLWTCSCPLRFPQIIEDSNCLSLENSHFDHNLSRWYALSWKNSWECPDVSRYSGALVAGTAVFDKAKEVGSDTLIGGGTSRYGNKLYFNSHTNGQQSGFDVFEKNGGNQESENGYTVKRNLRHINFKTDHDYCGVPTQLINTVADLESRRKVDSSKWILGGHVFRNLCLKLGTWTVPQRLLVSRISHQVAQ